MNKNQETINKGAKRTRDYLMALQGRRKHGSITPKQVWNTNHKHLLLRISSIVSYNHCRFTSALKAQTGDYLNYNRSRVIGIESLLLPHHFELFSAKSISRTCVYWPCHQLVKIYKLWQIYLPSGYKFAKYSIVSFQKGFID